MEDDDARAALLISGGGFEAREYRLAGEETLIGRSPRSDVTLIDESASREHAIVLYDPEAGTFSVEDLQSTNGTKVNGKRVRSAELGDGDAIEIGQTRLVFERRQGG